MLGDPHPGAVAGVPPKGLTPPAAGACWQGCLRHEDEPPAIRLDRFDHTVAHKVAVPYAG